jgi:hypothetical protein
VKIRGARRVAGLLPFTAAGPYGRCQRHTRQAWQNMGAFSIYSKVWRKTSAPVRVPGVSPSFGAAANIHRGTVDALLYELELAFAYDILRLMHGLSSVTGIQTNSSGTKAPKQPPRMGLPLTVLRYGWWRIYLWQLWTCLGRGHLAC